MKKAIEIAQFKIKINDVNISEKGIIDFLKTQKWEFLDILPIQNKNSIVYKIKFPFVSNSFNSVHKEIFSISKLKEIAEKIKCLSWYDARKKESILKAIIRQQNLICKELRLQFESK